MRELIKKNCDLCGWIPSSWRAFAAKQQPVWPDSGIRDEVLAKLSRLPSLVFAGETRRLMQGLADAAEGRAFILQAGDCAEEFSRCHGPLIHDLLKVILQMSVILAYAGERKVVKIGRIAGQYAKPRSSDTETIDGVTLPSYRGDMVNSPEPTPEARIHDPCRMLEGYFCSTATLNLIRAFTAGGYAALDQVQSWSEVSRRAFPSNAKYDELVKGIKKAIGFMAAIGLENTIPLLNQTVLYTSHEALLLEYEEALARIDTTTGDWYDTSANMLWIGDRTRQPDGAHVEYLRGVQNPIGMKVGPNFNVDDITTCLEKLNPENQPGRISLITRFGCDRIEQCLPQLIGALRSEGLVVTWLCDPMHGNTLLDQSGRKTRRYGDILNEIRKFWALHRSEGTIAGGVHLELTGEVVTECTGGCRKLGAEHLSQNYQTTCDPRLNAEQAVELAFELAEVVRS